MNDSLINYLENMLGPIELSQLDRKRLNGLPAFLADAYRFNGWSWLGQHLVLARQKAIRHDLSLAELKAQNDLLKKHFKTAVVLVVSSLTPYQRNSLIHAGIPFILPNRQIFVPPFASLTEKFSRPTENTPLSAAAQITVLYQLLRHPPEQTLLYQWAEWLGYSAMTLSKVRDELVADNLCEQEPRQKAKGLRFLHQNKELWEAAKPYLRSPVRRTSWAVFQFPPPSLVPAGLTALANRSLIQDDTKSTYAFYSPEWKRLIDAHAIKEVTDSEIATARVELWRYQPALLATPKGVDALSLHLSLAGHADERVQLAVNSLLEKIPW
jgi:hypothetical protein